jgi:hypothetical protein
MLFGKKCCARPMPMFDGGCCGRPAFDNKAFDPGMYAEASAYDMGKGECVVEPAVNKVVEKEIFHEVQHVVPVNTHVINKHIYNHSYTPQYTCSEEEQVCNIDNGSCCKFM